MIKAERTEAETVHYCVQRGKKHYLIKLFQKTKY